MKADGPLVRLCGVIRSRKRVEDLLDLDADIPAEGVAQQLRSVSTTCAVDDAHVATRWVEASTLVSTAARYSVKAWG